MAAVRRPRRILPRTRFGDRTGGGLASVRGGYHHAPLPGLKGGPAELAVLGPVGMGVLAALRCVAGGFAGCNVADVYLRVARLIGDIGDLASVGAPARAGLGGSGRFCQTDDCTLREIHHIEFRISLVGKDDRSRTSIRRDRRARGAVLERAEAFALGRFRIDPVHKLLLVKEAGVVDVAPVRRPAGADRSTAVGRDLPDVPAVGIAGIELRIVGSLAVHERETGGRKALCPVGERLDYRVRETARRHSCRRIAGHRLVRTDHFPPPGRSDGAAGQTCHRDRPGRSHLEYPRKLKIPLEALLIPCAPLHVDGNGDLLGPRLFDLDDRGGSAHERNDQRAHNSNVLHSSHFN